MPRLVTERADVLPLLAEVFREHGYEGASLQLISQATGLGKGSLYHFFPGGKAEMAAAVLAEIDDWFERELYAPLRATAADDESVAAAIDAMFAAVDGYFRGGGRVCLVGALALGAARDRFGTAIASYFARWVAALADALQRAGCDATTAAALAEATVAGIQGALVLTRALDDPAVFRRTLQALRERLQPGNPVDAGNAGR